MVVLTYEYAPKASTMIGCQKRYLGTQVKAEMLIPCCLWAGTCGLALVASLAQIQGHGGAKISPGEKNQEPHLKKKKKKAHFIIFSRLTTRCVLLSQNEDVE